MTRPILPKCASASSGHRMVCAPFANGYSASALHSSLEKWINHTMRVGLGFRPFLGHAGQKNPSSNSPSRRKLSTIRSVSLIDTKQYTRPSIFLPSLSASIYADEAPPAIWFIVIPEEIHRYGRPKSSVPKEERVKGNQFLTSSDRAEDSSRRGAPFPEDREAAEIYRYELNFHHQLQSPPPGSEGGPSDCP